MPAPYIEIIDQTGREWHLAKDEVSGKVSMLTMADGGVVSKSTKSYIDRIADILQEWSDAKTDQSSCDYRALFDAMNVSKDKLPEG